ncbi:MAG: sugar transferase [Candidatus Eiseniibacteriota bacterium]|nr:MAG: sugar transferase [Candidatus Eisenbacteria bacterium]
MEKDSHRRTRLLVVGTGDGAKRLSSLVVSRSEVPSTIVGHVDFAALAQEQSANAEGTGGGREAGQSVGEAVSGALRADEVLVANPQLPISILFGICLPLLKRGTVVRAVSTAFSVVRHQLGAQDLDGLPLVTFRPPALLGWRLGLKRVLDVLGALMGGIILLPVFLVAAIMVKVSSPGPVLFKQTRVGRNGREFTFYKFRSMVSGDDSRHREYLKEFVENGREAAVDRKGRKVYKIMDDPRITTFGRFLRRTSLDEFPQLINVLRGEMSLVGPRPCLPYEWALYEDWQKERLAVTPGLTGLWQVTGRSNVSFHDMVILDLFYIFNWSFWRDLKLILRTIPVIFLRRGAH